MKFRKKPIVIEAFRYIVDPRPEWFQKLVGDGTILITEQYCEIQTLEGIMMADTGDWIIQGVKGEIYPCQPDIFELSYEAVGGGAVDG